MENSKSEEDCGIATGASETRDQRLAHELLLAIERQKAQGAKYPMMVEIDPAMMRRIMGR